MTPNLTQIEEALDNYTIEHQSELNWLLSRYCRLFWQKTAKDPFMPDPEAFQLTLQRPVYIKGGHPVEVKVLYCYTSGKSIPDDAFGIAASNEPEGIVMNEVYVEGQLQDQLQLLTNNPELYFKIEAACFAVSQNVLTKFEI